MLSDLSLAWSPIGPRRRADRARTLAERRRAGRDPPRAAVRRRRRRAALRCARKGGPLVARKLPGLRRELDARSLFSVAYGEIASSIYFALGIIALHARRVHAARAARRRPALPARRALVRRGDLGAPRDRRRRDLRPPRVERPRRLHDRLGAVPRLPDRDLALGALRAALPRRRAAGATRSTAIPGT